MPVVAAGVQHADHAGTPHAFRDVVAEFAQAGGNDRRRAMFGKAEFGMGVKIAPHGDDVCADVGRARCENG